MNLLKIPLKNYNHIEFNYIYFKLKYITAQTLKNIFRQKLKVNNQHKSVQIN